jgi:gluconate kinase
VSDEITPPNPTWNCAANSSAASGLCAKCCPARLSNALAPAAAPNCHCADGKRLHSQYQISVLIDGKPKAFNIPEEWVEKVREKIEMRRRFDAAAATICKINLKRFLKEKEDRQP